MGNTKEINIKNRTYYFSMTLSILKTLIQTYKKIDRKLYKNIDIYYIRYIITKSISHYNSINSVNPLYFIIGEVNGYIEETKWKQYSTFAPTNLPLNKILKFHMLTVILRSAFEENAEYYPHVFLNEHFYEL